MSTETKRGRGRPSVMAKGEYEMLKALYNDRISTRRGILNKSYELLAGGVVKEMQERDKTPGLEYLRDDRRQHLAYGVLRELGKFKDHGLIKQWAIAVCKSQKTHPMTVHEIGQTLRTIRLKGISETVSDNTEVVIA